MGLLAASLTELNNLTGTVDMILDSAIALAVAPPTILAARANWACACA